MWARSYVCINGIETVCVRDKEKEVLEKPFNTRLPVTLPSDGVSVRLGLI